MLKLALQYSFFIFIVYCFLAVFVFIFFLKNKIEKVGGVVDAYNQNADVQKDLDSKGYAQVSSVQDQMRIKAEAFRTPEFKKNLTPVVSGLVLVMMLMGIMSSGLVRSYSWAIYLNAVLLFAGIVIMSVFLVKLYKLF